VHRRHEDKKTAHPRRRLERWFLQRCGCREVDEVCHDLDEELQRRHGDGQSRLRLQLWRSWQLLGIVVFELRDMSLRPRRRTLRPGLALLLATRSVRRHPGVPIAAALTLGLGFGAAAAIYGVFSGFGRPIPVPDGSEVRWVRVLDERGRSVDVNASDLRQLQSATSTLDQLGGFESRTATVRYAGQAAVHVQTAAMTPEVFDILRLQPERGRLPSTQDNDAVLISHEFWVTHLDGAATLGDILRVDGQDRIIVGVMPEGHRFPFNHDLWTMLDAAASVVLEPVARISPSSTPQQAAVDVTRILEGLRHEQDIDAPALRVEVLGFTEKRGEGGERVGLATVLALVVLLVLVSCSNVSNLLFARALARADRLAVHAALGAAPLQVALQMLFEAMLISLAGALTGLGLAAIAIRYIESTLSGHWGYYWMQVRFEFGVVLFALGLGVATGIVSGVMPALRLWRADLGEVLKSDTVGIAGGARRRLSSVLLNGQVAFSCFALVIAMLLAGGLLGSQIAEGFPAENVFVAAISLDAGEYDDDERRRQFRESLTGAALADDRLDAVALSNVPPGLGFSSSPLEVEGEARAPDARPEIVGTLAVTPAYFDIVGAYPVSGRILGAADLVPGRDVVVVSEAFVREFMPSADAVGRSVRLQQLTGDAWLRIVGVVADVAVYSGADERDLARAYVPLTAAEPRQPYVVFTGDADAANAAIRATIEALDPEVAVSGVLGLANTRVADIMRYVRRIYLTAGTLAILAGAGAAIVALIGLYGALAFEVQRRIAEIGVRMALGASKRDILAHVTRAGLRRVAPGLVIGLLASIGTGPLLGVFLGGRDPFDFVLHLAVYVAFLAVAVLATVIPGRRASRLDPVTVLRKN